ncbi:MAG: DUF3990 domain-containing protein [Paludibacter sp.]|jgi:Protein of unknown function (DUF3990)
MRIYHGSTEVIQHPTILDSQRLLDFGKGFYTTTNLEQARKWALIKQRRIGNDAKSFVTEYEFDDNLLQSEQYKVKVFNFADEHWLDFVVNNRKMNDAHSFDIVMGAVANDTLYKTLSLFETGILTKQETISRLKVHTLYDQISFHNIELMNEIKFIHFLEI